MCRRAPESRIYFVEQPQHFHLWKQKMVNMKMLWSSLNKFKLFTRYHNHDVRGGQLKTRITSSRLSHVQHMESVSQNFRKHWFWSTQNFIGRNDFKFLQDRYFRYLFTFHKNTIKDRPFVPAATVKSHMTWKLQTKVIKRPI